MLSGTIVPQFIDLLPQMKIESADQRTAQEFSSCFENCLKTFKGPCSSRRKIIEEFILRLSGSSNFPLLAKSFALLAFTGSNKQLQTNNSFHRFMVVCVYTLDTLLDANFNELHQLPYYSSVQEKPLLALNNASRMEKTLDFLGKFEFLSWVTQYLLDENFDGLVKIPVGLILNFIARIVAFKVNKTNTTANLESILNTNIIPAMHRSALLILNQLIITCSTSLSTSLKEVNKILIDLSDDFSQQQHEKGYLIKIRSLWYQVAANWFNKLGSHLSVFASKHWEERLITSFLDDIQPKCERLELQNAKKLQNERSTNTRFMESSTFSDDELVLCSAACQAIDSFLIHFARLMNAKRFHRFIYQLLAIIQDLYRVDLWRNSSYFVDPQLRLRLLKVFRNCLISFTNTSLLNNAITLFNTALKLDKSSDIQLFAKESLIIVNSPRNKIYYSTQDDLNLMDSVQQVEQLANRESANIEQEIASEESSSQASVPSEKQIESLPSNDPIEENANNSTTQTDETQKEKTFEVSEVTPSSHLARDEHTIDKQQAESVNESVKEPTPIKAPSVASISGDSSEKASDNGSVSNENLSDNCGKVEEDGTNADKAIEDQISNLKTPAKRATRSRTRSATEEPPATTRLTRSSLKKKVEERGLKDPKKLKTEQSEQPIQKQAIDEDSEGEIQEILKDFVDA